MRKANHKFTFHALLLTVLTFTVSYSEQGSPGTQTHVRLRLLLTPQGMEYLGISPPQTLYALVSSQYSDSGGLVHDAPSQYVVLQRGVMDQGRYTWSTPESGGFDSVPGATVEIIFYDKHPSDPTAQSWRVDGEIYNGSGRMDFIPL